MKLFFTQYSKTPQMVALQMAGLAKWQLKFIYSSSLDNIVILQVFIPSNVRFENGSVLVDSKISHLQLEITRNLKKVQTNSKWSPFILWHPVMTFKK